MSSLNQFIPSPVIAVASAYQTHLGDIDVFICFAQIDDDNQLLLQLRETHALQVGDLVTVHLDNRTGVSEYDAELSVYRLSYKGRVTALNETEITVSPIEYQVYYGISVELEYRAPEYEFPDDPRVQTPLPCTPLTATPVMDDEEHDNKVGVLITKAQSQPHTTVMAFLSSTDDDVFFITLPQTFKSSLMKRDNRCYFAIDNRASFTFENYVEWNYSIIAGKVHQIASDSALFNEVRELFISKNPWEVGFFSHPDIEMYHLKAEKVVCPKR
ncbi:hypothetical protein [Pseudoalteromonas sp. McH1-42]|uniref:hypothetical protein n=1 Tax=Pseudoalteromonas sp. McH1-42 TaxID=2917752 RepID=UPI001EF64597|nr:hypothetical protein [Pseudoalteromonas sp. McH1-42]MCG7561429.1 hypothetical protein [Pseudoalteromonas sp. McH1-42]